MDDHALALELPSDFGTCGITLLLFKKGPQAAVTWGIARFGEEPGSH
jgi:hypothetical protein